MGGNALACLDEELPHAAPWGTVDSAYQWVMAQLDPNHPVDPITIGWLTDQQRAGIKVTVNPRATPGDDTSPVTSNTVTITGEHGLIRLGDLQRSAIRVLTMLTHSSQFADLAVNQGVPGIAVQPYTSLFAGQLVDYVTTRTGPVVSKGKGGHHHADPPSGDEGRSR